VKKGVWGDAPPTERQRKAKGRTVEEFFLEVVPYFVRGRSFEEAQETLTKKMERGLLPFNDRVDVALQGTRGLHSTHDTGMVRRDIKSTTKVDRSILGDLETEFHYDRTLSTERAAGFLPDFDFTSVFDDQKQKSLYAHADSNSSVFIDGFGMYKLSGQPRRLWASPPLLPHLSFCYLNVDSPPCFDPA
jgi:hypothetical protein